MTKVLVGYYNVPGYGADSVEVAVKGTPKELYAKLQGLIQKKHPKVKGVIPRTSSRMELRDPENAFIEFLPGTTIAQLFEESISRKIGRVFFVNEPMEIVLVLNRGAGHVAIQLRSVLGTGGTANFSSKIQPQRLATELKQAVIEALGGNEIKDLVLNVRERSPQPKI